MKRQDIQLSLFTNEEMGISSNERQLINVASVRKRSPFRYPGGKTWLVPTARKWFSLATDDSYLVEPFAGGGIISLTAIAEHYFKHAIMVELDNDMAAAWQTILSDESSWLIDQIASFKVNAENINNVVLHGADGRKELAFSTIVRNRTNHGGILAKGSGIIKSGENGKGLASRWYPETLIRRIIEVNNLRDSISFIHGNAFDIMEDKINDQNAFFFIDPPYTVAGKRLYNHFDVDHRHIFDIASRMRGQVLMTYDDTPEVRKWAEDYGLAYDTVPMQTTHLITKEELVICNNIDWNKQQNICKKVDFPVYASV